MTTSLERPSESIAKLLVITLKKCGGSKSELSRKLGIRADTVFNWYRCNSQPRQQNLKKLEDYLKLK